VVLMSHLHPDHTNGIRALDGTMAFPNAEIMVPAKDWEFWMRPRRRPWSASTSPSPRSVMSKRTVRSTG
jgi:glyoxylase-like metal-dependent hydrolase (beta-lactamase superfamily II)